MDAKLEKMGEDAKELLEEFSTTYLLKFGVALCQKIEKDTKKNDKELRKLKYRKAKKPVRPDLFHGWCFMKSGAGPGDFAKWKRVYLAERDDFNIDWFASDKDFSGKKKPKGTIELTGYFIEEKVTDYYVDELKKMLRHMGLDENEANLSFSPYSWALIHEQRTNYVFQLHKGTDPFCSCIPSNSVEPEGAGTDESKQRPEWVQFMKRCVTNAKARDLKSVKGAAFEKTWRATTKKFNTLSKFWDDGTEADILVDMLVAHALAPIKADILQDIPGPGPLRITSWYKIRTNAQKTLASLAKPAWEKVQAAADKVQETLEPKIRPGLEKVLTVKDQGKKLLKDKVAGKVGEILGKYVTPYIQPLLKALDAPMKKGFEEGKNAFVKHVGEHIQKGLPADKGQRNKKLDAVFMDPAILADMRKACDELVAPLNEVKNIAPEIFKTMKIDRYKKDAQDKMFKTLDAAVYTLEQRMDAASPADAENIKDDVLKDLDFDINLACCDFIKKVARDVLLENVKLALDEVTGPVLAEINGVIPEDLQEFINAEGLFEEFVDIIVGEPINKVVEAAYPNPA